MDTLRAKGLAELLLQQVVYRVDDVVYDFDWSVYDPEFLYKPREGCLEKLVVEFNDDALLAFGVINALCSGPNRSIEPVERPLSTCSSSLSSMSS